MRRVRTASGAVAVQIAVVEYHSGARALLSGMTSESTSPRAWAGGRRGSVGVVAAMVAVLAVWLLAACGGTSSEPPESPGPPAEPSAALAPELVGSWETQHWLDSTGSRAIVRTYRFTTDGRYEYTLAQCQSSTDCTIQSSERGSAQAAGGILSLRPQTASADGPRSYPYVVGRDPDVGDLQLHLTLVDGEVDIFYAA